MTRVKDRLRNRELTLGSWLTFPCEASAEIMARAGFEWLVLDMEHSPIDIGDAARLIRVIDLAGVPALCRLPANDPVLAKRVLDAGAAGIIVPTVESADQARRAAEAAYYPPTGTRGVGLGRAHAYGSGFEAYRSRMESDLIVIAMIESRTGVRNVEAIARTPGIDGLLLGPYDLSGSYGRIGELDHPEVRAAREEVTKVAASVGVSCGLHIVHPDRDTVEKAQREGYTFFALGVDMILLDRAAHSVLASLKPEA